MRNPLFMIVMLVVVVVTIFWLTHRSQGQPISPEEAMLLETLKKQQAGETEPSAPPAKDAPAEPSHTEPASLPAKLQKTLEPGSGGAIELTEEELMRMMQESEAAPPAPQPPEGQMPAAELTVLKRGNFNPDATDSDRLHRGSGGVQLVRYQGKTRIIFDEDFTVTNGPDYRLYLLREQGVETERRFEQLRTDADKATHIAPVRQFAGYQTFILPDALSPDDVHAALIWCETFSQFITSADLR